MTTAYTYILQCANGQYYVGSTTDLDKRLQEHQAGLGSKFTRTHLPVKLVYYEEYPSITQTFKSSLRKKQKDMSFLLAQMKELKKTSTPDQTYPLYGTGLTAPPVAQTFLRPVGSKRRKASSEGKLRPSKVWLCCLWLAQRKARQGISQ